MITKLFSDYATDTAQINLFLVEAQNFDQIYQIHTIFSKCNTQQININSFKYIAISLTLRETVKNLKTYQ